MVLPALDQGGYSYKVQVHIGERLGVGRHFIDVVASKDGLCYLVSVKWQQVSGTAEQKVPFEVICLAEAMEAGAYVRAFIVLGGEGWKLREMYTSGGLKKYLNFAEGVELLTLEAFVARANRGRL